MPAHDNSSKINVQNSISTGKTHQLSRRVRIIILCFFLVVVAVILFEFATSANISSSYSLQINSPSSSSSSGLFFHLSNLFNNNNKMKPVENKIIIGKPVSYAERYKTCLWIKRNKNSKQTIEFFKKVYDDMMNLPFIVQNLTNADYNLNYDHNTFSNQFQELVHLRMHRRRWVLDIWLSTCSLILESVYQIEGDHDMTMMMPNILPLSPYETNEDDFRRKQFAENIKRKAQLEARSLVLRHVFLFTINNHESSIPPEFQPFVQIHDEPTLSRLYKKVYSGGFDRGGDLPSADFLVGKDAEFAEMRAKLWKENDVKNNLTATHSIKTDRDLSVPSQLYDFVWSLEHDVRYIGASWHHHFFNSRFVFGKNLPDLGASLTTTDEEIERDHDSSIKQIINEHTKEMRRATVENTDFGQHKGYFKCFEAFRRKKSNADDVSALLLRHQKEISKRQKYGQLPHLISFSPPWIADGYNSTNRQFLRVTSQDNNNNKNETTTRKSFYRLVYEENDWHFGDRSYFRGAWKNVFDKIEKSPDGQRIHGSKWAGFLMPFFGMSRRLCKALVRHSMLGESHQSQEVALPVTALLNNLKMVSTHGCTSAQYYFGFRPGETAPLYSDWAMVFFSTQDAVTTRERSEFRASLDHVADDIGFDFLMEEKPEFAEGRRLISRASTRYYGINTRDFGDSNQLQDVLVHPVKV